MLTGPDLRAAKPQLGLALGCFLGPSSLAATEPGGSQRSMSSRLLPGEPTKDFDNNRRPGTMKGDVRASSCSVAGLTARAYLKSKRRMPSALETPSQASSAVSLSILSTQGRCCLEPSPTMPNLGFSVKGRTGMDIEALPLPTSDCSSQDSTGILTLDTLAPSPKPKRKAQAQRGAAEQLRCFRMRLPPKPQDPGRSLGEGEKQRRPPSSNLWAAWR